MTRIIFEEDNPFVRWANIKYRKILGLSDKAVKFYSWDDYSLCLYYNLCKEDPEQYYIELENDFKEYVDEQQERVRTR